MSLSKTESGAPTNSVPVTQNTSADRTGVIRGAGDAAMASLGVNAPAPLRGSGSSPLKPGVTLTEIQPGPVKKEWKP